MGREGENKKKSDIKNRITKRKRNINKPKAHDEREAWNRGTRRARRRNRRKRKRRRKRGEEGKRIKRRIRQGNKRGRNGGELMGTKGDGWMQVLCRVTCDGARQDKCDS